MAAIPLDQHRSFGLLVDQDAALVRTRSRGLRTQLAARGTDGLLERLKAPKRLLWDV